MILARASSESAIRSTATHRRTLADAGESIERFLTGGVMELKHKLGPINWQFAPTKQFDSEDFEAFLGLLPKRVGGQTVRHAVEVRHQSFKRAEFVALTRKHGVAVVMAGDSKYLQIADVTAPFVYARIMGTVEDEPNGYDDAALDTWAERVRRWASGSMPEGLDVIDQAGATPKKASKSDAATRDVYLYVISGFKAHNPAASMALIERLCGQVER